MKVVAHYPKTEEMRSQLANKVSEVHASAVIQYLKENLTYKENIDKAIKIICNKL